MHYQFKEQVKEIFGSGSVQSYDEYRTKSVIIIEVSDFTAEKLFKLSDLLGTGTIRINPEAEYTKGYCDTCDYGVEHNKWIMLYAENVKF